MTTGLQRKKSVLDDLDKLLNKQNQEVTQEEQEEPESTESVQGKRGIGRLSSDPWQIENINGTSVNLVAILADDSRSMRKNSIYEIMQKGLRDIVAELIKINDTQKETFLLVRGFIQRYFIGSVAKSNNGGFASEVSPEKYGSPLVGTSMKIARSLENVEQYLNSRGISTSVYLLLLTDGDIYEDNTIPLVFKNEVVRKNRHWKIFGVGIVDEEDGEEYQIQGRRHTFKNNFESMGITKILTPSSKDLIAVMHHFSKSVSAI